MNALRLQQLAAERARRAAAAKGEDKSVAAIVQELLGDAHPKQLAAINDPARQVAHKCTRRSGKSRGLLRKFYADALTNPGSHQVYINTTIAEAKRIAWVGVTNPITFERDGLYSINERYGSIATAHKVDHTLTFPNGSIIELLGLDDERSIMKLLGGGYFRVWWDEAQKARNLQFAFQKVIDPALADHDGQFVMTGTPGDVCAGFFYDVTRDDKPELRKPGWSVHEYSALDNPAFGDTPEERYKRTKGRAIERNGYRGDEPHLVREWDGKWVMEDAEFVYAVHAVQEDILLYADARYTDDGRIDVAHALTDLPTRPNGEKYAWKFGLGADFGFSPDPFAITVYAYHDESPDLWEIGSWKAEGLIPDVQSAVIQGLHEQLGFSLIVADAPKGNVEGWSEEMRERYGIEVLPAKKAQKRKHIEFKNNDLRLGRIHLRRGGALYEEMAGLSWKTTKNGKREEGVERDSKNKGRKRFPNDCCDAGLYLHREIRSHHHDEPDTPPPYGSEEWAKAQVERMKEERLRQLREREERMSRFGY